MLQHRKMSYLVMLRKVENWIHIRNQIIQYQSLITTGGLRLAYWLTVLTSTYVFVSCLAHRHTDRHTHRHTQVIRIPILCQKRTGNY